jgi:hypothetical protein
MQIYCLKEMICIPRMEDFELMLCMLLTPGLLLLLLQVALYRWGYISEDGEYEEVGDGRMVFTANIDPALLSQQELQELQQEGEEEEEEEEEGAYADGPWLLSVKAGSRAGEMGWYGVDAVEWDVGGGLVSRVG